MDGINFDNLNEIIVSNAQKISKYDDKVYYHLNPLFENVKNYECSNICIVIAEKNCVCTINDNEIYCTKGNIILIHSPCYFCVFQQLDNVAKNIPFAYILNLEKEFFDPLFISQIVDCPIFFDFLRLPDVPESSFQYLFFDCEKNSPIYFCSQILMYQASYSSVSDQKAVRSACTLFFTELNRIHQKHLVIRESSMMPQYDAGRFLKYMADNYKNVTLESTARYFNFNATYFSILFKKLANTTFTQKLLEIKIEQAKRFLLTTNLSIKQIVELIGFSEKSYFYKTFKKLTGLTPNEYRKTCGNTKA